MSATNYLNYKLIVTFPDALMPVMPIQQFHHSLDSLVSTWKQFLERQRSAQETRSRASELGKDVSSEIAAWCNPCIRAVEITEKILDPVDLQTHYDDLVQKQLSAAERLAKL